MNNATKAAPKVWKKPQVTAITPVRQTRGGAGNIRPTENTFYATS